MKKPVYLLKTKDIFVADDSRSWVVDEIIKPDDWTAALQIGQRPTNFTILAHSGQMNRRFYYPGTKLLDIKFSS